MACTLVAAQTARDYETCMLLACHNTIPTPSFVPLVVVLSLLTVSATCAAAGRVLRAAYTP